MCDMFHSFTATAFSSNVLSKCGLVNLKTQLISVLRWEVAQEMQPHPTLCTAPRSVEAELPAHRAGPEPKYDGKHFVWNWPNLSGPDGSGQDQVEYPQTLSWGLTCSAVFPMMSCSSTFVFSPLLWSVFNYIFSQISDQRFFYFNNAYFHWTCNWMPFCGILCSLLTLQNITIFLQFESGTAPSLDFHSIILGFLNVLFSSRDFCVCTIDCMSCTQHCSSMLFYGHCWGIYLCIYWILLSTWQWLQDMAFINIRTQMQTI